MMGDNGGCLLSSVEVVARDIAESSLLTVLPVWDIGILVRKATGES
jgi:hypothetical protein